MSDRFVPAHQRLNATSFALPDGTFVRWEDATEEDLCQRTDRGGSVYDALVAAAAREHGVVLATRDRRALDIYRAFRVEFELLPN